MMKVWVPLAVMTVALTCSVHAQVSNCDLLCPLAPAVYNISGQTCENLCNGVTKIAGSACVTSLFDWAQIDTATGQQAGFASTAMSHWLQMISQSAKTYLANPTDFDSLEGIMMKGFMNDYGKIDQCKTIPSAQYCYTQILPKMIDSGGNAAATAGLCLPETCPAEAIQFVWKTLFDMPIPMGNSTGAASTMQVSSVFATKTVCGDQSVEWTIASVLVLVLCCLLAALVIVSTTIVLWADSKREAEDSAGAKHQESSGYKAISEHEEKVPSEPLPWPICPHLTLSPCRPCRCDSWNASRSPPT